MGGDEVTLTRVTTDSKERPDQTVCTSTQGGALATCHGIQPVRVDEHSVCLSAPLHTTIYRQQYSLSKTQHNILERKCQQEKRWTLEFFVQDKLKCKIIVDN
jgi:hypothetical protein